MTDTAAPPVMTTEELLAMPDDGVERWLLKGVLHENRGTDMTRRNRFYAGATTEIARVLANWSKSQPPPHGKVYTGDIGVRLTRSPDDTVGVDVIYATAEQVAAQSDDTTMFDGPPTVAVEILSPSNTIEEINGKLDAYLRAGVPLTWIADPHDRTVTVYRPGDEPVMFNARQELSADPVLPGFRTPVAELFE